MVVTTAWARSPGYGQAVVLGPTQEAVYRVVWGLTDGGRRPYVTLAHLAQRVGKPASSVHEALGRLRALGLIGCATRMGRQGGHRLWRVGARLSRSLDAARHARAVARIVGRFHKAVVGSSRTAPPTVSRPPGKASPVLPGGPSFRDRMREAGFVPWWQDRHIRESRQ
jgi:hypothetical protein